MEKYQIEKVQARQILDSRGNPTIEVEVLTYGGVCARAAVPSGKSKGRYEAIELRDGGKSFHGLSVFEAVRNVNDIIGPDLRGMDVRNQREIDEMMITLDGTMDKSKLGANSILGVSIASAKAVSEVEGIPLYRCLGGEEATLLPIPFLNVINGGSHAGNKLDFQEHMVIPLGAESFFEALKMGVEVYQELKKILIKRYGRGAVNVGDEGGFAPNLSDTREAMDDIIEAIEQAGFLEGTDFVLGIDAAASEFYKDNVYHIDGKKLNEEELLQYYIDLIHDYPLNSIEDPFDEKAFRGFANLTAKANENIQIVCDDITVSNIKLLETAIEEKAGNALLLKVNQIGSLTEAIQAAKMAFKNDFNVMVSHRSGETEDTFIADLAVGLCSGQIKTGAPARSDRCAKYNQLLRIEEILGMKGLYPKNFSSWKKFH